MDDAKGAGAILFRYMFARAWFRRDNLPETFVALEGRARLRFLVGLTVYHRATNPNLAGRRLRRSVTEHRDGPR